MKSLQRIFPGWLRGREAFIVILYHRNFITGLGGLWEDGLGGGVDAWRGSVEVRDWDQMKEIHGFRFSLK